MTRKLTLLVWTLCAAALSACSDGIGAPIRLMSPHVDVMDAGVRGHEQRDAAQPVDAGFAADADVPATVHCAPVARWAASDSAGEQELVELINRQRAQPMGGGGGGQMPGCGSRTFPFQGLPPLTLDPALRCSARLHTLDMLLRNYRSAVDPDGNTPGERIIAAGGPQGSWGEGVVKGLTEPGRVLSALMSDQQGCEAISSPRFTVIGVGYTGRAWTVDFASP